MPDPPSAAPTHAGFGPDLRIDWIETGELAGTLPGRLGLTFLPGKRGVSLRYPGHVYERDTAADLSAMREAGIVRLILLVEDGELRRWGDVAIVEHGLAAGVDVRRHPIPDGAPPDRPTRWIGSWTRSMRRGPSVTWRSPAWVAWVGPGWWPPVRWPGLACQPIARSQRVREVRHPTAVETRAQERFVPCLCGRDPRPELGRAGESACSSAWVTLPESARTRASSVAAGRSAAPSPPDQRPMQPGPPSAPGRQPSPARLASRRRSARS